MGIRPEDVNQFIQGAFQGYAMVGKIQKDQEKKRQQQSKYDLAQAIASGPTATGVSNTAGAIPNEQQKMLSEQTAGMTDPQPAIPLPQPPGTSQQTLDRTQAMSQAQAQEQQRGDQEIDALESMVQNRTGSPVITQDDWKVFKSELSKKSAAIGDPATVMKMNEYVDELQTKGFQQNTARAATAALAGNEEAVQYNLRKAWSYMEDGSIPNITQTDDGNYLITFSSETRTGADGSPSPSGNPMVMTPEGIGELASATEDPAEFAKWRMEYLRKVEADKRTAEKHEYDMAKAESDTTIKGVQAQFAQPKAEAALELTKAQTAKANASGKGGKWNDAAAQRVTGNINTRMKSTLDRLGKTVSEGRKEARTEAEGKQAWFAKNEATIINEANTIAKNTQDLDGANSFKQAVKIREFEDKYGPINWTIENGQVVVINAQGKKQKLSSL